jgi:hypothetical protein
MKENRFVKFWDKWGAPILLFTAALEFLVKEYSIGLIYVILAIGMLTDKEK